MDIELVLNELSLRPLADDIFVARRAMSTLLQTVNQCSEGRRSTRAPCSS